MADTETTTVHTAEVVRYDDPVVKLTWGQNPEGYCRNYADAATACPWRFDDTPPADSPRKMSAPAITSGT